jgi:hypothetical protein
LSNLFPSGQALVEGTNLPTHRCNDYPSNFLLAMMTTVPTATREEKEISDIFDLANHRRFSTRKRKNVNQLIFPEPNLRTKKNRNRQAVEEKEKDEIVFPLQIGTEIFISGKIKENPSFTGEVLVVQDYNSGTYKLEMANNCSGFWGSYILRSEQSLIRNISLIQTPTTPLIPIEFSVLNAVYDLRGPALCQKYPVEQSLKKWRWKNSWTRLTWTTQPLQLSYQHIFNLAQAAISDGYSPADGTYARPSPRPLILSGSDAEYRALCILPPIKGSGQLVKEYLAACLRSEEKYRCVFEYVWIFVE